MTCHIAEEHNTSVRKGSGVPLLIKHQVGPSNKKLGDKRGGESNIWLLCWNYPPTQDAIVTNYRVIPLRSVEFFHPTPWDFNVYDFAGVFSRKDHDFLLGIFWIFNSQIQGTVILCCFYSFGLPGYMFQSAVLIVMSK